MEYLIATFFAFVGVVIAFIAYTYHWISQRNESPMGFAPRLKVERFVYRAVDLNTVLSYTEIDTIKKYGYPIPAHDFATNVIKDAEHKQYLIRRQAQKLTDEMLASGLIEIVEI